MIISNGFPPCEWLALGTHPRGSEHLHCSGGDRFPPQWPQRNWRWREYLFLFGRAGVAIIYGAVNDQVTSAISWEYFYFWKGLKDKLGPRTPPETLQLHWEAAKIGMQAAWTLGILTESHC